MARRATVLHELRSAGNFPVLYVIGAREFSKERNEAGTGEAGASPELVQRLYDALHPDAGYLSSAEAVWFDEFMPKAFSPVGEQPVTQRIEIGGLSVALIFFPDVNENGMEQDRTRVLSSILAAAYAAANADLRIGVSPWGFQQEYAARGSLSLAFHIILGAGEGAHFPLDTVSMEPAVWVRAAENGRSVIALDLESCPSRGISPVWVQDLNIRGREIRLEDGIHEDSEIRRILDSR